MPIYFMKFIVAPTILNPHYNDLEGAYAHCWINEDDPRASLSKINFFIAKDHWEITDTKTDPVKVHEKDFIGKDIGLEQFRKAQAEGVAIAFSAWPRDGKSSDKQFSPKQIKDFDLNTLEKQKKILKNSKRCLHYNSGEECNYYINAHSIQRNGSLSLIAENGLVYCYSRNMSDVKSNHGKSVFSKQGIKKQVSTFFGFCKKHDNELFEEIDNFPLIPTNKQVALYAYRSICKELFVKENSYKLFYDQMLTQNKNPAIVKLLKNASTGMKFGLDNLVRQKKQMDLILKEENYNNIQFVLFRSSKEPNIVFSGLFYPEYDFLGNLLQDLGNHKLTLDLITFCSAKLSNGWGFLFAWNKSSSPICTQFMQSLATITHENGKLHEYLFRLVISNCENVAISPSWWESLGNGYQDKITNRMSKMADIFTQTGSDYLSKGLEGICQWEFKDVISEMGQ